MSIPTEVQNAEIGADQALVKYPDGTPEDAIDLAEGPYNADLTGNTDETATLQQALDDAEAGTTVYIPEGTLLISNKGKGGQNTVLVSAASDGVTLAGAGLKTEIKLEGGHSSNTMMLAVSNSNRASAPTDFTIRDLRLNGNRANQNEKHVWGVWWYDEEPTGDENLLCENVWTHSCNLSGNCPKRGGVVTRFCSSWDNGGHGFATDAPSSKADAPIEFEYLYARENGVHGINCSGGHTRVRHMLSEDNAYGGKNSSNSWSAVWEDVVFQNNEKIGYFTSYSLEGPLTMRDFMVRGNGLPGINFQKGGSDTITLDNIVALDNSENSKNGNIYIHGGYDVDAGVIKSGGANGGPGLRLGDGSGSDSGAISQYVHDDNCAGGALVSDDSIAVEGQTSTDTIEPLPLPTNP